MANLIIFRGKSATAKTLISSQISRITKILVLRKDDIFDPLSRHISDNSVNNLACYDILANIVQVNLDNKVDVILDIALSHNDYYFLFLSKLNLINHKMISFLCDCTDEEEWLSRWKIRLENPLPNQYFKSIEDIKLHYKNMHIELLDNEFYLDSSKNIDELINEVINKLHFSSLLK